MLGKKVLGRAKTPSFFEKVFWRYKQSGFMGLLWITVKRLTSGKNILFYNIYSLEMKGFNKINSNDFEYRILSSPPDQKQLDEIGCTRQLFERRLSCNHFYVMAFDREKPVGWLWAHEGDTHFEQQYGFNVAFRSNELFYYDSNTQDAWRKRGVLRGMLAALVNHLEKSQPDKERIVAIIEAGNLDSRVAHRRIGFSKQSLHVFFKIGQRKFSIRLG